MGHDRGDYVNVIPSSEDEEGYSSSSFPTSLLDSCEKKLPNSFSEAVEPREFVSDDTDQQFWAEDELSSSDSRPTVPKRQRRHGVAHRNRTYRSRSRLNHTSSSSSYLSNVQTPQVRRRKKRSYRQDEYPKAKSKSSNSSTRRNILRRNFDTKIRSFRNRRK